MSLTTSYLGLPLKSPIVASASPLNAKLDNLRRLEDAGAAAVVLPSLFQEQIEAAADRHAICVDSYADSSPEAQSYFPEAIRAPYGIDPDRYLELVRRARDALGIPIIASLNGTSQAGWIEYARLIERAGATALEVNLFHVPTDLSERGRDIEDRYIEIVSAVRESVSLPVSVKMTPFLSSIGNFATTLVEQGARGLVLFNRSMHPDIDVSRMKLTETIELSDRAELRLPLLWIAILSGRTEASLAASTGVATVDDVVKCILAGADTVMTTSSLLRNDIRYMTTLTEGLRRWMDERQIASVDAMRGLMSWRKSRDCAVYTRANYIRLLENYAAS